MSVDGGTQLKLAAFDKIAAWVTGQPFTNVLLILILGCVTGGLYGAVKYAVPVHLQQIQAGYERIEQKQTEQLKSRDEEMGRAMNLLESLIKRQSHAPAPANGINPENVAAHDEVK